MNKKKIIITASVSFIVITILTVVLFLPYAIIWKSFSEPNKHKEVDLLKFAIKISLLKPQKIYALEAAIPSFVITRDYKSATKYVNDLEKLKTTDNGIKYLAAYSYMQLGDYENALQYAIESENKKIQHKIYNKIREKRK